MSSQNMLPGHASMCGLSEQRCRDGGWTWPWGAPTAREGRTCLHRHYAEALCERPCSKAVRDCRSNGLCVVRFQCVAKKGAECRDVSGSSHQTAVARLTIFVRVGCGFFKIPRCAFTAAFEGLPDSDPQAPSPSTPDHLPLPAAITPTPTPTPVPVAPRRAIHAPAARGPSTALSSNQTRPRTSRLCTTSFWSLLAPRQHVCSRPQSLGLRCRQTTGQAVRSHPRRLLHPGRKETPQVEDEPPPDTREQAEQERAERRSRQTVLAAWPHSAGPVLGRLQQLRRHRRRAPSKPSRTSPPCEEPRSQSQSQHESRQAQPAQQRLRRRRLRRAAPDGQRAPAPVPSPSRCRVQAIQSAGLRLSSTCDRRIL